MILKNTLNARRFLTVNGKTYTYFSLAAIEEKGIGQISRLPRTIKILLENLIRHENERNVTVQNIEALSAWNKNQDSGYEIAFSPVRVLMQDFTGVPAIVDLAAMRNAIQKLGGTPSKINPLSSVDLVIDHSVQVDYFNSPEALQNNVRLEMERNRERYEFLRWGQNAFSNFRVVPPGMGICHQVNLEFLSQPVWTQEGKEKEILAYPDTVVGMDSHTTMINALGVLGWGVGGIEAEAALLGQPIFMRIPQVIGVQLIGQLSEGVTATDLVLTITEILRKKNVVGKFVEYFGSGLKSLSLPDRATLANMAPEYGATCGFFPIDPVTLDYLRLTNRNSQTISLIEAYTKKQDLWHDPEGLHPIFTEKIDVDLNKIKASLAGPKRPQDRIDLNQMPEVFNQFLNEKQNQILNTTTIQSNSHSTLKPSADNTQLAHGSVVIAAITSCTNTSNPTVMMMAGLLAKKAFEKGLKIPPWVKTSLAPGSPVVSRYLEVSGLQEYLNKLGFYLVGYGCTTCVGNSGPLPEVVSQMINQKDLIVSSVLSGNRNFEGRIHPQVKANWLASPPLVVVFALAGTTRIDLTQEPLGADVGGQPVYLRDIWPSNVEVTEAVGLINQAMFQDTYQTIFLGDPHWQTLEAPDTQIYPWRHDSTYIKESPFFSSIQLNPDSVSDVKGARILALLGDSITTDHISPTGNIKEDSPAGQYLLSRGVTTRDFNSFGARRGNYEVMVRGTFANIRIKNEMVPGVEGGFTRYLPTGEVMSIFEASKLYQNEQVPLVVIAGKEYGTGSSRDWAAKGPKLLGIKVVIAESFERIHRSNLIGMGILPLQFLPGGTRMSLGLDGSEVIDILDITKLHPRMSVRARIHRQIGHTETIPLLVCIDTATEVEYYQHGGILPYVLRNLLQDTKPTNNA